MIKFSAVAACILLLLSCKQQPEDADKDNTAALEFKAGELPAKTALGAPATEVLAQWKEYNDFDLSFDAVYNSSNNEDLKLAVDDLLDKYKLWEESEYPAEFDVSAVKSRQKIVKTFLLKTKADLEYRREFHTSTSEMIAAYNALRDQFSVVLYSNLDTKLILDE